MQARAMAPEAKRLALIALGVFALSEVMLEASEQAMPS